MNHSLKYINIIIKIGNYEEEFTVAGGHNIYLISALKNCMQNPENAVLLYFKLFVAAMHAFYKFKELEQRTQRYSSFTKQETN